MRIYIAAPLFSHAELAFNVKLAEELSFSGHDCFLPQSISDKEPLDIAHLCLDEIRAANIVVAVLDGSDVDSGTALEIGYAIAKNKRIFGLRTDARDELNLMFHFVSVHKTIEELRRAIDTL